MDSANNCHVLERVKLEIYHYVGGQDKCQWSDAQIEGEIYFENIYFLNYNYVFILCQIKNNLCSNLTPGKSYANMQHPLHYNLSEVSFKDNNNYYCQYS